MVRLLTLVLLFTASAGARAVTAPFCTVASGPAEQLDNPLMFVTQFPVPTDFATIGSVFANHDPDLRSAGRGGDLFILFPGGELCNITREGGFGSDGEQSANAISVRDPDVHFDGTRAVFSMVVGAPSRRYERPTFYWQLYEVTGLALGQTVTITKVPNQPSNTNNIMPVYAPDDTLIFVSDRAFNGAQHLYPQLDEYESTPTPSGLWKLDPANGSLKLMQHSPSGSFDPLVDSFGRVLFTRWDHLQRDQQTDGNSAATFGSHDFSSEEAGAARLQTITEYFPEPRVRNVPQGSNEVGHNFNHFFPWMINLDGTEEETLNHIGRHELHRYFTASFDDDSALSDFVSSSSGRTNQNQVFNVLQMAEDPTVPGRYIAVDAPEFQTHASGLIFAINASPTVNPDDITVEYLTHPDTESVDSTPSADHSGHYRNPAMMSNGRLLASHTSETGRAENRGSRTAPNPSYMFQVKMLEQATNGFLEAGPSLTGGIVRTIEYWDPDAKVTYTGPLWELNPVEVRSRPTPTQLNEKPLATPEQAAFDRVGVDVDDFRCFLKRNSLALMVARDVTTRDLADEQQPFNLRVPGGVETARPGGPVYDVSHLQYVQGDMIRGYDTRDEGRRILPRFLHAANVLNANPPVQEETPLGSVPLFADGSMASFVPVRRAMSWQLTAPDATPVVRERYWITFQPGEIRVCDGCHGVNKVNQVGAQRATNESLALEALLLHWKSQPNDVLLKSSFEGGNGGAEEGSRDCN